MTIRNSYAYGILALASFLILYLFLGERFIQPNDFMFVIGGDGLFIYYNLLFHTCHGHGLELSSMNYPWNEFIFMTDAQGAIAVVFSYLDKLGLPICENAIGLMHGVIYALIPLAAIFNYKILRRFDVNVFWAFIASLLIGFMSPQIARMNVHFSLAYPFILPMCLDWFLSLRSNNSSRLYTIALFATLLFFGLNNPYVGFIASGFLILSYLFEYLIRKYDTKFMFMALLSLLPLILIYIILKSGDQMPDRVQTQWGYFYYNIHPGGLFLGEGSLFRRWFGGLLDLPSIIFESRMNVGVVVFFSLIILIALVLISKSWRSRMRKILFPLLSPALACICMYIYADNFIVGEVYQSFIEDQLGVLTMFKSAARFVWPSCLLLSIISVIFIDQLIKYSEHKKGRVLTIMLILPVSVIWTAEAGQYVRHRFETNNYENVFIEKGPLFESMCEEHGIDNSKYQAIYILPKMQGWSDKLIVELDYTSHHNGVILSQQTGIPMINAMLSRMSISQSILSEQFSSHPIIEKELLSHLDGDRKILILASEKSTLDIGSKYLIEKSNLLDREEGVFGLYELDLAALSSNPHIEKAIREYEVIQLDSNYFKANFIHFSFEEEEEISDPFSGAASKINKGVNDWLEFNVSSFDSSILDLSFWTFVDHRKYGLAEYVLIYKDQLANVLDEEIITIRSGSDFYHNWIRTSKRLELPQNTQTIQIKTRANQTFYVDELLLKNVLDTVILNGVDDSYFLYNNYRVNL